MTLLAAAVSKFKQFKFQVQPLKFKDQPAGRCGECKWNQSEKINEFWCKVPITHLRNPICVSKRVMVECMNLNNAVTGGDGEDFLEPRL